MPLAIPSEYGYVIGAVGCAFVPLTYGAYRVVQARKKYGVKYPDLVRASARASRERPRVRRGCVGASRASRGRRGRGD